MAHAIKTVLTYNLDGATKDFNIPFEYLARKFVVVTLIGVDRKVLVLNQDYRFATRTTISTTLAWGQAQGYTQIELRRYTSATERLVDFTDGSILRAYDLNVAQVQTLHVAEEARDLTADTIGVNNDGHLDARGRRIVNVANAVDDRDAVPFGQLKEMGTGAWQARNQAEQFKDQAKGFRDEAEVSRNAAEAAKARAGASELKAKDWAVKMDGPVETVGDLWSAKRYSELASTDRANAAVSANAAAADAQTAKEHGNRAQTYSNAARTARDEATAQADRAKTEADKLENNNKFAGTIDNILDANPSVIGSGAVNFKASYAVNAPVLRAVKGGMSLGSERTAGDATQTFINFYNGSTRLGSMEWADSGAMTLNAAGTFIKGNTTVTGIVESDSEALVAHDWAGQYNTTAPFYQNIKTQSTSAYFPIIKQRTYQAGRWAGAWSVGTLLTGAAPTFHVHLIDENGGQKIWTWEVNGNFTAPGDMYAANLVASNSLRLDTCTHTNDGNVWGSIWGNDWLNNYLNRTFKKKTKNWVLAGSGAAGAGGTIWLNQDIRFRQCWIRTTTYGATLHPVYFGGDGMYFFRPDPGWVRCTLSSNGTALTNNQDDNSPIGEVWVEVE